MTYELHRLKHCSTLSPIWKKLKSYVRWAVSSSFYLPRISRSGASSCPSERFRQVIFLFLFKRTERRIKQLLVGEYNGFMDEITEANTDISALVSGLILAETDAQLDEIEALVDRMVLEWNERASLDIFVGQMLVAVTALFINYCMQNELDIADALREGQLMELIE